MEVRGIPGSGAALEPSFHFHRLSWPKITGSRHFDRVLLLSLYPAGFRPARAFLNKGELDTVRGEVLREISVIMERRRFPGGSDLLFMEWVIGEAPLCRTTLHMTAMTAGTTCQVSVAIKALERMSMLLRCGCPQNQVSRL